MTGQFVPRRGARGSGSATSQLIRLLRQVVGERPRHLVCVAPVDDVTRDEPREEVRVHAARWIVAGGNRAERAGVIVEAGGLVDPSGLRGALAEAPHAFDRVVEPPG